MHRKASLTPYITNIIKIIALIMMFCHHFLRNDSWLVNGNHYISLFMVRGYQLEIILGDVGKLCVALFAVLSGFGLYYSFNKNASVSKLWCRLRDFICQYLIVFVCVFVPVFFLSGNTITVWGFIKSLITIDPNMNMFSWYVHFYVMAVPVLWLIHKIHALFPKMEKIITIVEIAIILVTPFVNLQWVGCLVSDFLAYFPSFLAGYLAAKYNIYEILLDYIQRIRFKKLFGVAGGATVLILRHVISRATQWKIYIQLDAIWVIIFILFMILVFQQFEGKNCSVVYKISKATANMWYLHAIFFGAYADKIQWIAYLPKYSVLVIVWVFAMLLSISYIIDYAEGIFGKCIKRKRVYFR